MHGQWTSVTGVTGCDRRDRVWPAVMACSREFVIHILLTSDLFPWSSARMSHGCRRDRSVSLAACSQVRWNGTWWIWTLFMGASVWYWMHFQIAIPGVVAHLTCCVACGGASTPVLVCLHGSEALLAEAAVFLIRRICAFTASCWRSEAMCFYAWHGVGKWARFQPGWSCQ